MHSGVFVGLALLATVAGAATRPFEFADIGRHSNLDVVVRRYPGSQRVGDYLYVAPGKSGIT
jgi:hypothetical protein